MHSILDLASCLKGFASLEKLGEFSFASFVSLPPYWLNPLLICFCSEALHQGYLIPMFSLWNLSNENLTKLYETANEGQSHTSQNIAMKTYIHTISRTPK